MNCALSLAGRKIYWFYPKVLPLSNYEEEWLLLTYYVPAYHWSFVLRDVVLWLGGNENSAAGHIKCSRGPQVPHPLMCMYRFQDDFDTEVSAPLSSCLTFLLSDHFHKNVLKLPSCDLTDEWVRIVTCMHASRKHCFVSRWPGVATSPKQRESSLTDLTQHWDFTFWSIDIRASLMYSMLKQGGGFTCACTCCTWCGDF